MTTTVRILGPTDSVSHEFSVPRRGSDRETSTCILAAGYPAGTGWALQAQAPDGQWVSLEASHVGRSGGMGQISANGEYHWDLQPGRTYRIRRTMGSAVGMTVWLADPWTAE